VGDRLAGIHHLTGLVESFAHAYRGLLHAASQRNMKIHVVGAVLVGLVGSTIPLGLAEKVSLIFCVLIMFFAEILNTALEALVDLHTEDFRELAKTTKDAAAASVLVLAIGTVVIFASIVFYNWSTIAASEETIVRQGLFGAPLVLALVVLLGARPRPRWLDDCLFVAAAVCWGLLWPATVSWVFTTLTGMLVVLAWRVAKQRASDWHQRERAG
jgi:diacylglycerol kinase (ATP)